MALRERVLQCSLCGFEKKRAQDVFWQWEEELWNSTEQHHSEQNSCFVIENMVPQYNNGNTCLSLQSSKRRENSDAVGSPGEVRSKKQIPTLPNKKSATFSTHIQHLTSNANHGKISKRTV